MLETSTIYLSIGIDRVAHLTGSDSATSSIGMRAGLGIEFLATPLVVEDSLPRPIPRGYGDKDTG